MLIVVFSASAGVIYAEKVERFQIDSVKEMEDGSYRINLKFGIKSGITEYSSFKIVHKKSKLVDPSIGYFTDINDFMATGIIKLEWKEIANAKDMVANFDVEVSGLVYEKTQSREIGTVVPYVKKLPSSLANRNTPSTNSQESLGTIVFKETPLDSIQYFIEEKPYRASLLKNSGKYYPNQFKAPVGKYVFRFERKPWNDINVEIAVEEGQISEVEASFPLVLLEVDSDTPVYILNFRREGLPLFSIRSNSDNKKSQFNIPPGIYNLEFTVNDQVRLRTDINAEVGRKIELPVMIGISKYESEILSRLDNEMKQMRSGNYSPARVKLIIEQLNVRRSRERGKFRIPEVYDQKVDEMIRMVRSREVKPRKIDLPPPP